MRRERAGSEQSIDQRDAALQERQRDGTPVAIVDTLHELRLVHGLHGQRRREHAAALQHEEQGRELDEPPRRHERAG